MVCALNYSKVEHLANLLNFPTLWRSRCAADAKFGTLRHQNASRNLRGMISLDERIDTTSPAGELVFHVFGAIAQFERRLISKRTKD